MSSLVPGDGFLGLCTVGRVQVTLFIHQELRFSICILERLPATVAEQAEPGLMDISDESDEDI